MDENYPENIDVYKLLETLPGKEYDAITELASVICNAPLTSISFISDAHQFYKSHYGYDTIPGPIDQSFSRYAFNQSNPIFIVEDARTDERFKDKSYVINNPKIIFYTGFQLITSSNEKIGMLSVCDCVTRILTDIQINSLQLLANQTVKLVELHKSKIELDQSENKYRSCLLYTSPSPRDES
jgi:GAF domain-containing protein